jgi:hypothetical protein
MRNHRKVAALSLGLVTLLTIGCQGPTSSQPGGLRTFHWAHDVLCSAAAAARPVTGVLRGQQGTKELIWIEDPSGHHLSVLWPDGFSVGFAPTAELRDDTGALIARDGDVLTLTQTNLDMAAGTFDDPYLASGLSVGAGCYPFVKG